MSDEQPAPSLADVVAAIRAVHAKEDELSDQLAAVQARRHSLEAALAAQLRAQLGEEAAAAVAQALAPPDLAPTRPAASAAPASGEAGLLPEAPGFMAGTSSAAVAAAPPPPSPPRPLEWRGVNYYPSRRGWWRMWCDWRPDEIARELDLARGLNMNTIRTFLPFSVVEGRPVNGDFGRLCPADPLIVLDRLDTFLDLTAARGMRVILGLLDESDYLPELIQYPLTALTHIDRVLNYVTRRRVRLGDDPRILAWDLVNELDDEAKVWPGSSNPPRPLIIQPMFAEDRRKYYPTPQGDPLWPWTPDGLKWLRLIYNHVFFQSSQYITMSVLNPFSAVEIYKAFPDPRNILQFHLYLPYTPGNDAAFIAQVENAISIIPLRTGGRRALLGEFGAPSALQREGITWTEALQRDALRLIASTVARNTDKVLGALIWTLTDWSFAGAAETPEKYNGLFTADLRPKPAAEVIRTIFAV